MERELKVYEGECERAPKSEHKREHEREHKVATLDFRSVDISLVGIYHLMCLVQ